jgi:putative endonuclease
MSRKTVASAKSEPLTVLPVDDSIYVYMLACRDGTLYTGWTNDIEKRLRAHNAGNGAGAKYTRGRRPVTLVYTEVLPERGAALTREAQIKRLPRAKKLALIRAAENQDDTRCEEALGAAENPP